MATLDSSCSSNVVGQQWMRNYIEEAERNKTRIQGPTKSSRVFILGDRERMKSEGQYTILITMHGHEVMIEVNVVNTDLPLLLARGEMERFAVILHLDKDEVEILSRRGPLTISRSGQCFQCSHSPSFIFLRLFLYK